MTRCYSLISSVVRILVYWTVLPQRKHCNIHCCKWCIIGDNYLGGFCNNKRLISLIYWTMQYWIWWIWYWSDCFKLTFLSCVQSRLYLGLGRDGLLPAFFSRINSRYHTPVTAQLWVGFVAATLAGVVNVSHLSHILSVGCLVRVCFAKPALKWLASKLNSS